MHQSIPAAPSPPPGYYGEFARLVIPRGGALANFRYPEIRHLPTAGPYLRAFDTHVVSYANITTQRILLEKQAYWLMSSTGKN